MFLQHFADDLRTLFDHPGDIGEIVRIAEGKCRFRVQWPKGLCRTLPLSAVFVLLDPVKRRASNTAKNENIGSSKEA